MLKPSAVIMLSDCDCVLFQMREKLHIELYCQGIGYIQLCCCYRTPSLVPFPKILQSLNLSAVYVELKCLLTFMGKEMGMCPVGL